MATIHGYDFTAYCPICKEKTPHDYRNLAGNICKVCGVVRSSGCEGAFQKCPHCGEFIPVKTQRLINMGKEEIEDIPAPQHVCAVS